MSGFLLLCYPLLMVGLVYAGCIMLVKIEQYQTTPSAPIQQQVTSWETGINMGHRTAPFVVVAIGLWYVVATFLHRAIINSVTHATTVSHFEEPRLFQLLEPLCISRGVPVPKLAIIESASLNAFASGLSPNEAQITVTRGLLDCLTEEQLEAVLAHELSHVLNRDIELLIVSAVFVGLLAFLAEASWRMLRYGSSGESGKKITALLGAIAVLSSVGYLLSILLRFALSRSREYLADAGAVELTKNPDALVAALENISGRSELPHVPSDFKEMLIDYPRTGFFGLFSTHPPLEHRIHALRQYANASTPQEAWVKPKRSPWQPRADQW